MSKGTLYPHDRMEAASRIEVMLLNGMTGNNLTHRKKRKHETAYADPLVRWCGKSVK